MAGELVFTVGHSTHSAERFIELLRAADVTAVADVRSSPYSRFNPQFNKQDLKGALKRHEIAYAFVGQELGARSSDPKCYCDGRVVYSRLAQTALFKNGLKRIRKGAQSYRIALMCAEREPLECHRTLLVSRYLAKDGVEIRHILASGHIEQHFDTETRLIKLAHQEIEWVILGRQIAGSMHVRILSRRYS